MCVSQIDLAFDHVPQAGTFPGQDHFDFEFSLSGQLLLTHHALDGLLRSNTHLLEVFPHRNIELFHLEPPKARRRASKVFLRHP
jgi:hypothetical protein